jgi:hypothetical protein
MSDKGVAHARTTVNEKQCLAAVSDLAGDRIDPGVANPQRSLMRVCAVTTDYYSPARAEHA